MLVHHGEAKTDAAPGAVSDGQGPWLSETGRRQSEAVAAEMKGLAAKEHFELVLSSPLPAALATAELITDGLSVGPPQLRDELAVAGLSQAGVDAAELVLVQERAWSVVQELRQQVAESATLVLVTHELTIRALVCRALSMPLSEMHRFALDAASITTIEFRTQPRERTLIAALNETCHLEDVRA